MMSLKKNKKLTVIFVFILGIIFYPEMVFSKNINGKEVIIVSSYHPEYIWSQLVNGGIVSALMDRRYSGYINQEIIDAGKEFEDSIYWMRSKYLETDEEKQKAAEPIIEAIKKSEPDIVIVEDDNAAKFIIPSFINSPIQFIFCGVNGDPRDYGIVPTRTTNVTNVRGILERYPFNDMFRLIRSVLPDREDLYVFYDDSETGHLTMDDFTETVNSEMTKSLLSELNLQIQKQFISNDWEEWKNLILSLQNNSKAILFFQNFYSLRDKNGDAVDPQAVVSWIRSHSKIPEFGHSAFQINLGLMSAVGTDAAMHGYQAGLMAAKLINGVPIEQLPIEIENYRSISVNKTRIKELDIHIPFDLLSGAFVYEDEVK